MEDAKGLERVSGRSKAMQLGEVKPWLEYKQCGPRVHAFSLSWFERHTERDSEREFTSCIH